MINKKVNAFTLAEVLITLVIIGVVAALTIPNVIQHYKKQAYTSKLKKFFSMMNQVIQKAEADGKSWRNFVGTYDNFRNGNYDELMNVYILPYLQYTKIVEGGRHGDAIGKIIYLNDGSSLEVGLCRWCDCIWFFYDVNGDKQPNTSGRDTFEFDYCGTMSGGADDTELFKLIGCFYNSSEVKLYNTREKVKEQCSKNGYDCSNLLLKYDNWEFKDDYPRRL